MKIQSDAWDFQVQWWHVQNQLHEIVPKIMQISWFLTDLFQKYKRTFLLEQCSTWCGSSLSILRNLGRQLGGGSHSGGAPHIILIKLYSWFRLSTSLLAVTPCYWCHCHWLLLGHVAALARCGLLLQMSWCSVVRLSACVRACVCVSLLVVAKRLNRRRLNWTQGTIYYIYGVYVPPRAGQWLLNFPARYLPAHKAHMPKTSSIRPAVSTEHRHETDTDRHMVIDIVPR